MFISQCVVTCRGRLGEMPRSRSPRSSTLPRLSSPKAPSEERQNDDGRDMEERTKMGEQEVAGGRLDSSPLGTLTTTLERRVVAQCGAKAMEGRKKQHGTGQKRTFAPLRARCQPRIQQSLEMSTSLLQSWRRVSRSILLKCRPVCCNPGDEALEILP